MSYEPSFSKRPGGVAARPRFFSLLGLGSDAGDSGAPALKVIIDDENNPSSSRDVECAVSLLHTLDSAGDQGVARDSSFPPKPQTPPKNQQAVSPVAQKFGRRAGSENKPKTLSPSKSNQLKESPASLPSNHHGQAAGPKNNSSQKTPQKPNSPQHVAKGLSPAKQNQPQPQQPTTNENEAPAVSTSVVSPNVASMKPSNVKFGFSKFGFSFSKPKAASPKPVKSVIPSALGSPIAAAVATPRLHEQESVQEASSAAVNAVEISSLNSVPLETPVANHVSATAASNAPAAAPDNPSDAQPHLIVGLSSRAQQLMAELAAEDQSFGALDFLEPVKKEKRVLIEKSNLVRKNVKSGPRHPAPFVSVLKSDLAEPVSSRANMMKSAAPQNQVSAAGAASTAAASAAAPADPKQVEHLKRIIDNLRAQLDAARNHEKKVVTLENQLAEQNGLVESMRKEIRLYQRQEVLLQRQEAERLSIEEQFNSQLKIKDEDIRVLKTRLKKYRELQEEEHKSFLQQQQRINKLGEQLEAAKKRLQCLGADPNFSEVAAKESLQQKNEAIAALEKENKILKKALEVEQRSKAIAKKLKDGGKDGVEELRLQLEAANVSLELAKQENFSLESRLLLLESKNPASNQSSRQTSAVAPNKRGKDVFQAAGFAAGVPASDAAYIGGEDYTEDFE